MKSQNSSSFGNGHEALITDNPLIYHRQNLIDRRELQNEIPDSVYMKSDNSDLVFIISLITSKSDNSLGELCPGEVDLKQEV